MSKETIATANVKQWIIAGVSKTDCELYYVIKHLDSAILETARLEYEIDEDEEKWRNLLKDIQSALFRARDHFDSLYNEVKDQIFPSCPSKRT